MKTSITACLLALILAACATPPGNEQAATKQVPETHIFIRSMTQQQAGLAEVRFSRTSTFLYGNSPLELAINDVVLAEISSGEYFSIWLKPGSYTFSVKPMHTLNSPSYPQTKTITMGLKTAGVYKVRISANMQGPTLQQEN